MKRSLPILLALLLSCSAALPSIHAAGGARENKRLQEGKITKNQAEHLVLQKYPGAKINKCVLTQSHGHGVWMLDVVKAGTNATAKVQVDGLSGKILP
ncbi:MAG: PepSY domain-containing protein [Chthoniobacterales bacterium]